MRTLINDDECQGKQQNEAKRIDEIAAPILQSVMRHFDFEGYLDGLESDAARKHEIMIARSVGFIGDATCISLLHIYKLKSA